ncbi:hypothetical protein [Phenylobacterium immobile]|uniref:hypothetical protein n=1 Tax=Phenylobacterium immobile TaxID=21 RepID=UPI000B03DD99|nr:hypothetical protein [Phenylobacterium immobile]
MTLSQEQLEKLCLHSAFGLHLVAKWMAGRDDVDPEIRERLSVHITAIEGVLMKTGHDWIETEINATETALQA